MKAESKPDEKEKAEPKTDEKERVEPKTRLKKSVECERRGAGELSPKPGAKLRCTYQCPGDPPDFGRITYFDNKQECPETWTFWL